MSGSLHGKQIGCQILRQFEHILTRGAHSNDRRLTLKLFIGIILNLPSPHVGTTMLEHGVHFYCQFKI